MNDLALSYPAHLQYLQHGYEAAMQMLGYDAIILCSGGAHLKNRFDDQTWPLSITPSFAHWCPLVEADAYLIIRPTHRPTLVRTVTGDYWETPELPESEPLLGGVRHRRGGSWSRRRCAAGRPRCGDHA